MSKMCLEKYFPKWTWKLSRIYIIFKYSNIFSRYLSENEGNAVGLPSIRIQNVFSLSFFAYDYTIYHLLFTKLTQKQSYSISNLVILSTLLEGLDGTISFRSLSNQKSVFGDTDLTKLTDRVGHAFHWMSTKEY